MKYMKIRRKKREVRDERRSAKLNLKKKLQNCKTAELQNIFRVEDRARTGDLQSHNLAL
jgi:hypothetical protein